MHVYHTYPDHSCVDVDTDCLLQNPPKRMDLDSIVERISHERRWFLQGSDGRSYHFDQATSHNSEKIEGFLTDNGYERHPGYNQGELAYVLKGGA
jgi:hypothetical protein